MPQRPRSHELEELSRTAFRTAAPSKWAIDDVRQDYGVDLHVEIFDDAGSTTGEMFLVQLKATGESDLARALRVRLKVDHLAYYASLDLPVLLVLFHEPTGALYAKWVHAFDPFALIDENRDQETVTLPFKEDDRWDENTPDLIRAGLRAFRDFRANRLVPPVRFRLQIDPQAAPGIPSARLPLELLEAARAVQGVLEFDDALEDPCPMLIVEERAIVVDFAGVSHTTFCHTQYAEHELTDRFRADAFIAVAVAFARLGHSAMASRLTEEFLLDSIAIANTSLVAWLSWAFVLSNRFMEAIELADRLAEPAQATRWTTFQVMTRVLTLEQHRMSKGKQARYEQLLVDVRERVADNPQQAAIASYNLGNFFRNAGRADEALEAYDQAASEDPRYLKHGYFHRERAGVLFGIRQYSDAVLEHQQALDRGEGDLTPALHADALLLAGRYAAAEDHFTKYLATTEDADGEWRLKIAAIRHLRAVTGLDSQERNSGEADRLAGTLNSAQPASTLAVSADVLLFDALNPYAWWHRAAALLRSGTTDHADVVVSYLTAALLLENDPMPWASAIALMHAEPSLRDLFEDAVQTAHRFCRHNLIVRFGDFPNGSEVLEDVEPIIAATKDAQTVALRAPHTPEVPELRVERPR
jgi:tetratricopeptide (TPR) repeat protein